MSRETWDEVREWREEAPSFKTKYTQEESTEWLGKLLKAVEKGKHTGIYLEARDLLRLREFVERPLLQHKTIATIPEWIKRLQTSSSKRSETIEKK